MTISLLTGDVRDVLPTLADASVHCVVTSPPYYALRSYLDASHPDKHRELGSEPTPDAYIAAMVAVFREVKRVLRPDGTVWCNLGDSYAGGAGGRGDSGNAIAAADGWHTTSTKHDGVRLPRAGGKPKDLLLMPARLALALQADGWWVRSDIIWAKPNPMPESCTDRPTSAHEHVFLLTKRARYYYDSDAVREPHAEPERGKGEAERNNWSVGCSRGSKPMVREYNPAGRSCRNVWTIATHAYPAAHFATYPPELAERCIRAGTSERGCCAACGAPWVRQLEMTEAYRALLASGKAWRDNSGKPDAFTNRQPSDHPANVPQKHNTTGWSPSCTHDADVVPCTVLDPFSGAGTTLLVADRLQRHAIGIDLNASYADLARRRIEADAPLFTSWAPAEDPADQRMADLFAEAAE